MTALTPQQKDAQALARRRVRRIRDGIKSYIHTLGDIAAAYAAEDWKTLGYPSWAAYVAKEFGAREVGLPPEQRQKAIEELRLAGLPNRAIAAALNVNEKTVRRDTGAANAAPIEGEIVDSPARSPLVEAITGAIEDATERAGIHREPAPGDEAGQPAASHPATTPPAGRDEEEAGRSGQVPASSAPDSSRAPGFSGEEAGAPTGSGAPATDPGVAAPVEETDAQLASSRVSSEQGGPATSPAGPPCGKCGGPLEVSGECLLCAAVDAVPAAYLPFWVAENEHGYTVLVHRDCGATVAGLAAGTPIAHALVDAHLHTCT